MFTPRERVDKRIEACGWVNQVSQVVVIKTVVGGIIHQVARIQLSPILHRADRANPALSPLCQQPHNSLCSPIQPIQLIISRLMQAFLNSDGSSSANAERLLRKVAGQALAMLAMDNCLVMLKEPEFVEKLKTMILIHDDKHIYMASSLLRNLCLHARPELRESDLKELSHTMREVLERIMDAEGAELEVLIGLSSQICKVIPEDFARELENGQVKQRFVKRLVDALNANMKPSACCPGIRRVILEQATYMMECNSGYANCFNECRMMEALSVVEKTPSKAENYRLFLGDAGFMEYNEPLSSLVDRAKELMGHQWLRGISNVA